MKKILILITLCFITQISFGHGFDEFEVSVQVKGVALSGTLTMPAHAQNTLPLVIVVAGSGATDRDCNSQGVKSDAYKKMASQFAMNGIASYRFDKRGIGKSVVENMKEEDVDFNVMIADLKAIIAQFENDKRFNKIIVAGHSEGSLVGMKSVTEKHKYISIAGSGLPISAILKEQLKGKLGTLEKETYAKIDSLQKGKRVANNLTGLESLFRPSVQPFLISWMALNPVNEIKKLKCPVLVINGTKDLQVKESNATALHEANKNSSLSIIPNMNHLLTEIESDKQEDNFASYQKPDMPISKKMMDAMILFILK